jgi:hypothetical protein
MECRKSAYLPWKTVTLLKSRSMVCCFSTEDNCSHFLQWKDNRWTLPGTDYEFNFPFWSWRTRLLVSARWGYGAYSKFNNAMLSEFFGGRIISRNLLPPRSPDLSPLGFYLWGFLKENVHRNKTTRTIRRIEKNTGLCISNVTAGSLHRVASNTRKRVNSCIAERDGHFQHLI